MPAVQLIRMEMELSKDGNLSFEELCAGVEPGHEDFLAIAARLRAESVEMEEDLDNNRDHRRALSIVAIFLVDDRVCRI